VHRFLDGDARRAWQDSPIFRGGEVFGHAVANSLSNFDTKSMMWVKMATCEGILFCVADDILAPAEKEN
jgi:hypothetical protein